MQKSGGIKIFDLLNVVIISETYHSQTKEVVMFAKLKIGVVSLLCAVMCLTYTKGSAGDGCSPCAPCPTNDCCFSPCDFDLGIGIFYDQKSERHMLPYLTLLYNSFTLGFGVSAETIDFGGDNGEETTFVYYVGHIGYRFCLCPCLYLTGGASGMWASSNHRRDSEFFRHPFVVGPYIGLDYHFSSCLLFTAQILPYARHRFFDGGFENQYFQQGMIGVSYLF